jgi:hypothetical protein
MDVSWHITANPAPGQLNTFIMEPNLAAVVGVSGDGWMGRGCSLRVQGCGMEGRLDAAGVLEEPRHYFWVTRGGSI